MVVDREIFFHVGLGKNASTYLQYQFFPKLKGIRYIQRTKYHRFRTALSELSEPKILLSREFDLQLETELNSFSKDFPDAKIILIFRRHDDWIASQYRRYIKNGGFRSFEEFFDVKSDKGLWKISDLDFVAKLAIVKKYFHQEPLVLFYEDLKEVPFIFFDKLANYMGVSYDRDGISLAPVHKSYSERQLKFIRSHSKTLFRSEIPRTSKNRVMDWLLKRSRLFQCYLLLYLSKLIPNVFLSNGDLIPEEQKKDVENFFEEDWKKIRSLVG